MTDNPKRSEEGLQAENDRLRAQIQQLEDRAIERMRELAQFRPNIFARIMCETALGCGSAKLKDEDGRFIENPWARAFVDVESYPNATKEEMAAILHNNLTIERMRNWFGDAATMFLKGIEREEERLARKRDGNSTSDEDVTAEAGEYVSLREWLMENASCPDPMPTYRIVHSDLENLVYKFFDFQEEQVGWILANQCELVFHGVPIYLPSPDQTGFTLVGDSAEDSVYLRKKGEHRQGEHTGKFPFWVDKYYFRRSDLSAYKMFFSGVDSDTAPAALDALRDAYRRHLGNKVNAENGDVLVGHSTRLLSLVRKVLERYYGANFDISDRDTYPKQVDVIRWLREEFAPLSEKQAEAVDIVTRPDPARSRRG